MYKISNNFSPLRMNEVLEVRNEHPYNLKQGPSVFQALSNINILQHWNSFLFRVKSLGYTPKHLQIYRLSRQIQKGYKKCKPKNCPRSTLQVLVLYRKRMLELFLANS